MKKKEFKKFIAAVLGVLMSLSSASVLAQDSGLLRTFEMYRSEKSSGYSTQKRAMCAGTIGGKDYVFSFNDTSIDVFDVSEGGVSSPQITDITDTDRCYTLGKVPEVGDVNTFLRVDCVNYSNDFMKIRKEGDKYFLYYSCMITGYYMAATGQLSEVSDIDSVATNAKHPCIRKVDVTNPAGPKAVAAYYYPSVKFNNISKFMAVFFDNNVMYAFGPCNGNSNGIARFTISDNDAGVIKGDATYGPGFNVASLLGSYVDGKYIFLNTTTADVYLNGGGIGIYEYEINDNPAATKIISFGDGENDIPTAYSGYIKDIETDGEKLFAAVVNAQDNPVLMFEKSADGTWIKEQTYTPETFIDDKTTWNVNSIALVGNTIYALSSEGGQCFAIDVTDLSAPKVAARSVVGKSSTGSGVMGLSFNKIVYNGYIYATLDAAIQKIKLLGDNSLDETKGTVYFNNTTDEAITPVVAEAVYGRDKKLKDVRIMTSKECAANKMTIFSGTLKPVEGDIYKVFAWSDFTTMKPYGNNITVE